MDGVGLEDYDPSLQWEMVASGCGKTGKHNLGFFKLFW